MTPAERVRRLVQAGTVATDEGERLLAAMDREPRRSPVSALVNPFDRFGGGVAAVAGVVVSGLALGLTRMGVRFDGFLDLHVAHGHIAPLRVSMLEQLVGWGLPAVLLFAYARVVARHVRLIDFVGVVGLARAPIVLAAVPIALLSPDAASSAAMLTPGMLASLCFALACLGWSGTLLYQGFKNASGMRGPALVGGLIGMVIASEAASKLALAWLR
jgi:hypothetical protein